MIQKYNTDGGGMSLCITEQDAPGMHVRITDGEGGALSDNPESETMLFGLYHDDSEDGVLLPVFVGREGLLAWYVKNVGYSPDEDIGGETPILKLMENVASLMLLNAYAELKTGEPA